MRQLQDNMRLKFATNGSVHSANNQTEESSALLPVALSPFQVTSAGLQSPSSSGHAIDWPILSSEVSLKRVSAPQHTQRHYDSQSARAASPSLEHVASPTRKHPRISFLGQYKTTSCKDELVLSKAASWM